jgi:hypothetical protein
MAVRMTKAWNQMNSEEKIQHLSDLIDDFINFQNGANARMSTRIKALEDALTEIDKDRSSRGES